MLVNKPDEPETTIQSTFVCQCVDNTAVNAVAMGNDSTHETVKSVIVKVQFLQECAQNRTVMLVYNAHQDMQKPCGYYGKTVNWTTVN